VAEAGGSLFTGGGGGGVVEQHTAPAKISEEGLDELRRLLAKPFKSAGPATDFERLTGSPGTGLTEQRLIEETAATPEAKAEFKRLLSKEFKPAATIAADEAAAATTRATARTVVARALAAAAAAGTAPIDIITGVLFPSSIGKEPPRGTLSRAKPRTTIRGGKARGERRAAPGGAPPAKPPRPQASSEKAIPELKPKGRRLAPPPVAVSRTAKEHVPDSTRLEQQQNKQAQRAQERLQRTEQRTQKKLDKIKQRAQARYDRAVKRIERKRISEESKQRLIDQLHLPKTLTSSRALNETLTRFIRDRLHLPNTATALSLATGGAPLPGADPEAKARDDECRKNDDRKRERLKKQARCLGVPCNC